MEKTPEINDGNPSKFFKLRQIIFAEYFTRFVTPPYEKELRNVKKTLFEGLKQQAAQVEGKRRPKIVEIGGGAGANVSHLPLNCELTVIDPNSNFQKFYKEQVNKRPDIMFNGHLPLCVEDVGSDIIPDASIDAVIVTAVGCSVSDVQKYYEAIIRMLIPGGKFYYIEHIRGRDGSWVLMKQKIAMYSGIWNFISCGCHCDRPLDALILKADFAKVEQHTFYIRGGFGPGSVLSRILTLHVAGVATK